MLRVIFDTNVIVSANLFINSEPYKAVDYAFEKCKILVSEPLIQEYFEVLNRPKFDKYVAKSERLKFLDELLDYAEFVLNIGNQITICRDRDDNKFLELASAGNADYIITGDPDLLVLNPFKSTQILSPAEFLKVVC